tara:strand:+ start:956 stop:1159 length:204 start_codon:yes stop_codon:yes gene_type:complete
MKKEKCPMCKKSSSSKFEPFCSENCANKDLGNWLTGKYYIPGEKVNDEMINENPEIIDIIKKDKLDF